MKFSYLALVIFLSAAVAFGVGKYMPQTATGTAAAPTKETAFQRVMRTNTLRCGYIYIHPEFMRDPVSGSFSGVAFDLLEEIAKRLSLKVEWTEEVNFLTVAEGMKTGRYDAFCFTTYRWIPSARAMEYSVPLFYTTTAAYVRPDDLRFDQNIKAINDVSVKVATIDSEASMFIRAADFPQSTAFSMPSSTDFGLVLEAVATRKADVALINPLVAMNYLNSNRDKVRMVKASTPLRSYAHSLAFAKGEHDLTSMINLVVEEMLMDGSMDKILNKYESIPDSFIRIKTPMDAKAKD